MHDITEKGSQLSRRSFVAAAAASAAVTGIAAGGTAALADEARGVEWDEEADVVVVGMGFAGMAAALESVNQGNGVILLEKAPEGQEGGNSRVCGQAMWCPKDIPAAMEYFKKLATPDHLYDLPDSMIEKYLTYASNNPAWVEANCDITLGYSDTCEYKNAGYSESGNRATNAELDDYSCVWNPLSEAVKANDGIAIEYGTPLADLVFGASGEVLGVVAGPEGARKNIKAKKGVVLCLGGFEFNEKMIHTYLRDAPLACGSPFNTGDGHLICQKYDIDFWHMNAGTQCKAVGARVPWADETYKDVAIDYGINGSEWFWTDKYGRRFMNEDTSLMHGWRAIDTMLYKDAVHMEQPRNPFWQICGVDELGWYGRMGGTWAPLVCGFTYSDGFEQEIEAGMCFKCETVEELAEAMGVELDVIKATLDDFNAVANGEGEDAFGRDPVGMRELKAPYYAMQLEPYMINTDGGPRRDENANIVHTDGTPVERLYSAGEFGSLWGHWYQGGGNVAECFAFGRIAAENIAQLPAWDEA